MAPRRNSVLAKKIADLQLRLAPLVPLPTGPPHAAFPRTLLAYHLLTEEQLDSIAHYYHQSTPSVFTHEYPACMNWDKDFFNATARRRASQTAGQARRHSSSSGSGNSKDQTSAHDNWLDMILASLPIAGAMTEGTDRAISPRTAATRRRSSQALAHTRDRRWSLGLSDSERIAIKRRKVGKFIGLVGMDTPIEEIEGRIQMAMERAIRVAREESRRTEEWEFRRKKMA